MLGSWLGLLPIFPALIIFYEDFQSRKISVIWIAIFAVSIITTSLLLDNWNIIVLHVICNISLLIIVLGGAFIWRLFCFGYSIETKARTYIGAGDIIMMFIIGPLFSPVEYISFLLFSSVSGLIWWGLSRSYSNEKTIPLAGIMALILIGISLYRSFLL